MSRHRYSKSGAVPKRFKSPGGRTFTVSAKAEKYHSSDRSSRRAIFHKSKEVGTLFHSEDPRDGDHPWSVSTRKLIWSGEIPPTGLGFDTGPKTTAAEALAKFGRSADEVLDWREGRRVPSIYSKTGSFQKGVGS